MNTACPLRADDAGNARLKFNHRLNFRCVNSDALLMLVCCISKMELVETTLYDIFERRSSCAFESFETRVKIDIWIEF